VLLHTIFSEPARTQHYQLLEGMSSLVLGIHCQPANTFSERRKRGAIKRSNILEAVSLAYTFWFYRCLLVLCSMNSGWMAHYRCSAFVWQKAFGRRVLWAT